MPGERQRRGAVRSWGLLATIGVVAACGGAPAAGDGASIPGSTGDGRPASHSDGGTPVAGDSGGSVAPGSDAAVGGDGGSAPDTTGPGAGRCPAYLPLDVVGRSWKTATRPATVSQTGVATTNTSTVTAVDDRGTHVEVRVTGTSTSVGSTYSANSTTQWIYRCDGSGARLIEGTTQSQTSTGGQTYSGQSKISYSPGVLLMVPDPVVGTTWQSTSTVTTSGVQNGVPFNNSVVQSQTTTVTASEAVTVPGGSYSDALRLLVDWGSYQDVTHWVAGVGNVQSKTTHLTGYTP